MMTYPHLFSPITLGHTVFRNRIFASPTGPSNLSAHDYPTAETIAYYERKALGGAASVCIGDAAVDSVSGKPMSTKLLLDDPGTRPSLSRLTYAITRHGAVASIELQHGGSHSFGSWGEGHPLYGPVETVHENGTPVLEMTEAQIMETIEKFAKAAAWAKRCGFGMVTIHGGHGWLISQFVSPLSNTRRDRWGGSVENRCRLPVMICEAVRKAVGPGFPVEIRISGSECHPGGYDIDEGIAFAKQLDGHVDLIHVSAGSHEVWDVFTVTHPSMFLEDGANVRFAAEIKKHVNQSAVATVGALAVPALMEEIIASGKADVVEVARGLLADPDLPLKARLGRDETVNTCMRCLACFSNLIHQGQFLCAINPEIGHELEYNWQKPAAVPKRVLIAGGGIAGMQAALTAQARGHQVILCEKTDSLGGTLRCEDGVPFKKHLAAYLARQARSIAEKGIDLRLNTTVTVDLVEVLKPDVLIAALGARPVVPNIPGIHGENVFGAEEVYLNPEKTGTRVVLLGGGLVGTELAIHLAQMGKQVSVVEMLPALSDGGNLLHGVAIGVELRRRNIQVSLSTKALEITSEGVLVDGPEGVRLITADTVIYAVGQRPLREEADALRFLAPEFYQLGDCLTPKNITEATRTADTLARDLGRY